jgi:nicotinamide-nucleotide amidase
MLVVELGYAAPLGDWFASLGQTPAYRGGVSLAAVPDLLRLLDCQDEEEAFQRAKTRFDADWLLMVDEYPQLDRYVDEPMGASEIRWVVVTPTGRVLATRSSLGGHPEVLQPRIAKAGLAWMRRALKGLKHEGLGHAGNLKC